MGAVVQENTATAEQETARALEAYNALDGRLTCARCNGKTFDMIICVRTCVIRAKCKGCEHQFIG